MNFTKELIRNILNDKILRILLTPWRKYYWWNKTRINPKENKKTIAKILKEKKVIKLELGSSKRKELSDWIASDINGSGDIKIDFTKPIPFPNESVDYIYSSHVLEHFSYPSPMLEFLKECHRILKKDGVFSIAVPNAKLFLTAYFHPDDFDKDKFCSWEVGLKYKTPIDYVNFIAYLGGEHKHLFDIDNLKNILEEAGFTNVKERVFDSKIDLSVREHESIYAIGNK